MKHEIEAKIEYQTLIGETNPGGYRSIRFTRVKYKASPTAHMDIRQFQHGYDSDGNEEYFPTKKGFRIPERQFRRVVREYALLPETYVHPIIVERTFELLNSGQYESAVLPEPDLIQPGMSLIIEPPSPLSAHERTTLMEYAVRR